MSVCLSVSFSTPTTTLPLPTSFLSRVSKINKIPSNFYGELKATLEKSLCLQWDMKHKYVFGPITVAFLITENCKQHKCPSTGWWQTNWSARKYHTTWAFHWAYHWSTQFSDIQPLKNEVDACMLKWHRLSEICCCMEKVPAQSSVYQMQLLCFLFETHLKISNVQRIIYHPWTYSWNWQFFLSPRFRFFKFF